MPFVARVSPAGTVHRVGYIGTASTAEAQPYVEAFTERLRELGWVEGLNIVIEIRTTGGRVERVAGLTAELIGLGVDVIAVVSQPGALAARTVTTTTPIVMVTSADPVAAGLAKLLSRPGGNVTGQTLITGVKEEGKRLELLKEAVPQAVRVAYLAPKVWWNGEHGQAGREAAALLGLTLIFLPAGERGELEAAFEAMRRDAPDAIYIFGSSEGFGFRRLIVDFALKNALPTMSTLRAITEAGGLMSYGASLIAMMRGAAGYVDRILRGAKPADLPIERPSKLELVVNLKTARALGLTIPRSLLLRADQVIE